MAEVLAGSLPELVGLVADPAATGLSLVHNVIHDHVHPGLHDAVPAVGGLLVQAPEH